jgi:hypothetical protein
MLKKINQFMQIIASSNDKKTVNQVNCVAGGDICGGDKISGVSIGECKNKLIIDGKEIDLTGKEGKCIFVRDKQIFLDDSVVYFSDKMITIKYEGPALNIHADGNVVCGNVEGSVVCQGNVECGNVGNSVKAEGNVICKKIEGNFRAEGNVIVN